MPIIALTADVAFGEPGTFEHYGFNGVLTKPVEAKAINRVLDRIYDGSITEQEIISHTQPIKGNEEKELQVRDYEQALRITGGKKSVADKLFSQLVDQLPDYMASIKHEYINKDWKSLWQVLHKLHGATSVCGVPAFNKVINNMQKQVRKADYLTIGVELQKLEKEAERIIDYQSKLPRR